MFAGGQRPREPMTAGIQGAPSLESNNAIKVTNLPMRVNDYDVRELFEKDCGNILNVDCPMDENEEANQGYAIITFENDARKALNLDGHRWFGRPIKVAYNQSSK